MASAQNSQLVFDFETISTLNYCACACMALLLYYNLTTFDVEVKHYTRPALSGASVLYLLNRYLPLAVVVYNGPFWSLSRNKSRCGAEQVLGLVLESLQCIPWAAFSGLRAYALQRRLYLAQLIFVFSLSPVIITAVAARWTIIYVDPLFGCSIDEPMPMYLRECFAIVARLPLILADIAVILITWRTQYAGHRLSRSANKSLTFATVMVRDGTMYFVVLTLLNICQMIFEILGVFTDSTGPGILSKFIEPLTAILVSSFLTDLHKAASAAANQESLSSMGTVEFRVIGSIGASLPGPNEEVEDETLAGDCVDDELAGHPPLSRGGLETQRQPDVDHDV